MSEQRSQQDLSGRVRDISIGRCLAPNCYKEVIKKYKNLRVCGEDCWNRYLADQAWRAQVRSYAEDVSPQLRREICLHNICSRNAGSVYKLEQAQLTL